MHRPSCFAFPTCMATKSSSPMRATSGPRRPAAGMASRLTAHPGLELFAKFSPDGKRIAFTGQYDGDEQVYVIPSSGGEPKQLTYYPARGPLPDRWGFDNQVYGWTPDGKSVLFRSMREGWTMPTPGSTPFRPMAGCPKALPMPVSGGGTFSPDGKQGPLLAADPRVPHLEALSGGMGAGPVHLRPGQFRDRAGGPLGPVRARPDVDRRQDLLRVGPYRHAQPLRVRPGTKGVRQLTTSTEHDVRWPSAATTGRIVYELGGELYVLDLQLGPVEADPDHRAH